MNVNGPRDLPDFRLWLLDQWRPPNGLFHLTEKYMRASDPTFGQGLLPAGAVDGVVQRRSLPCAALWWVAEDMAQLIEHAARSLPETTLTEELIPDADGLVFFARPLVGTMCDTGGAIATDVMAWSRGVVGRQGGSLVDSLNIASYRHVQPGEDMGSALTGQMVSELDLWTPTGTATWAFGTDTDATANLGDFGDGISDQAVVSTSEDRRWLAALWLLASQPLSTSTTEAAYRGAAKRSKRANVTSDVRIVDIRARARPKPDTDGEGEHAGRAGYSHRFIVGGETGGFWRQQAYGPHHSLRRPKWIDPFEKGPKDKPLRLRETVKVVRGDSRP